MLLFLFLLMSQHSMVTAISSCQSDRNSDHRPRVSCVSQDLAAVPNGIDPRTQVLVLFQNVFVSLSWADYTNFTQLHELDLSQNLISTIDRSGPMLEHLHVLRLSNNSLTGLGRAAFNSTPSLMEVYLDGNNISSLDNATFSDLPHLEVINLSRNKLHVLPSHLLKHISSSNLKSFNLQENYVQHLPDNFFPKQELPYVFLSYNLWVCTCQVSYLQQFLDDQAHNIYILIGVSVIENDPNSVVCSAPLTLQGQAIIDLQEEEYCGNLTSDTTQLMSTTSTVLTTTTFLLNARKTVIPTTIPTAILTTTPTTAESSTTPILTTPTTNKPTTITPTTTEPATTEKIIPSTTAVSSTTPILTTPTTNKPTTITPTTTEPATTEKIIPSTTAESSTTPILTTPTTNKPTTITLTTTEPATPTSTPATTKTIIPSTIPTAILTTTPSTAESSTTLILTTPTTNDLTFIKAVTQPAGGVLSAHGGGQRSVMWCWWLFITVLLLCIFSAIFSCMLLLWLVIIYITLYQPIKQQVLSGQRVTLRTYQVTSDESLTVDTTEEERVKFLPPDMIRETQPVFRSVLFISKGAEDGEADERIEGSRNEDEEKKRGTDAVTKIDLLPAVTLHTEQETESNDREEVFRKTLYRVISQEEEIEDWKEVEEICWGMTERDKGRREGGAERRKTRYSLILREERESVMEGRKGDTEWLVGEWEMKGGQESWESLIRMKEVCGLSDSAHMDPSKPVAETSV